MENTGKIIRVMGPVVDVRFREQRPPDIFHAVEVRRGDEVFTLEVLQHLGGGEVRCISMQPTDGLSRGLPAVDTGRPISVPVGENTLGRMINVTGDPIDRCGPIAAQEHWPIHHSAPKLTDIVTADEVLESPYAADDLARKAHFVKGRSLQAAGDEAGALTHYREVTDARTRDAAESYYHIISILFKQGNLKEAEQEVFTFSEQNLPYQYWMGKAFLVLGDIYVKQGDAFQAKATYQSIVDGYTDKTDGVVDEALKKIESLK